MLALSIFAGIPAVSAAEGTFTTTAAFDTYFYIWAINGTVNDNTPTLVWNTTAEYFDIPVTITPNAANSSIIEFGVPNGYMGADIYEGATLKTGTANYTLSVPYAGNSTDVPALDWLALTAANGTGNDGIYKRVQLISNQTAATDLTIRVYYATAPAVGVDGVNDLVKISDHDSLSFTTTFDCEFKIKYFCSAFASRIFDKSSNEYQAYYNLTAIKIDSTLRSLVWGTGVFSQYSIYNITTHWDNGSKISGYINDVFYQGTTNYTGTMPNTAADLYIFNYDIVGTRPLQTQAYSLSIGTALLLNASSFSGGASTTVTDYSGAGNHGTAYGNVQYKAYTGTGFAFTVDDDAAPTYDNVAYNTTTIRLPCLFSARWADDFPLAGYIFSYDNGTGSMANGTWAALSGTLAWANVTKTLNATGGTTIRYQWFCNDSVGNWNSTALLNFTTVAPSVTPVVTLSTLYTGYHAGDTVTFVSKITANGVPQESINLTLYINGTMLNGTTDALGIYSYDLDYPGGETTAVASLVSNWWQESEYRYLLAANSSTITVTSGVTNMEGTYVGVYVAFLAVAFACFAFSMKSWDTWMPSFLFPATSAVLWSILSVLSFSVYTDTLTSWNLWMISPLCVIFAFASVLVTAYRAFDSLRQASAIQVDEE